ncbi:hypothetical protein DL546_008458 [Coniochaeta pulveracea]|uniref:Cyclin n=1 Tax=Coniochaeta pulveracea TaxID=177199 RepID=A0A420YGN9_9PEZI|nr:hypothetical protein DL546_008458 [Coniochaeta pulveracea]
MYPSTFQLDYRPPPILGTPDSLGSQGLSNRAIGRTGQHASDPEQQILLSHYKPAFHSGLRTPPSDEMGTKYQLPNMAAHQNPQGHYPPYATTVPASYGGQRGDPVFNDAFSNASLREQYQRQHHMTATHGQSIQPSAGFGATSQAFHTSRSSTRPNTPSSATLPGVSSHRRANSEPSTTARDAAMVLHSLEMPPCIGAKGGDLVDLVAQITCMIWFEPISTLRAAENIRSVPYRALVRRLDKASVPNQSFKAWVRQVLETTQVTQNVILLALLYIYRLKMTIPTVRGQPGSEHRLLTVALMLGNKFLDDNTYTNKTWADVSGLEVKEIHVMEVEFLQNLQYNLLASKAQWEEWLVKLSGFREYCERAQRPQQLPLAIPAPGYRSANVSPLSSPTGMLQVSPHSQQPPLSLHAYSPGTTSLPSSGPATAWPPSSQVPLGGMPTSTSPLGRRPAMQQNQSHRKRSLDEAQTEPPAKRLQLQPQHSQPQAQLHAHDVSLYQAQAQVPTANRYAQMPQPGNRPDAVRLPVPNLTSDTNTASAAPSSATTYGSGNLYVPQQGSALSLPPLMPGVRAMSTVFPPTTTSFTPQLVLGSTGSAMPAVPAPVVTPISSYPMSNYTTPTKRMSPGTLTPAAVASYASSPLDGGYTYTYPSMTNTPIKNRSVAGSVHTPLSQSPSVYLQQRQSPYKPVRQVNTLLYPPPSAFLQEYHFGNVVPAAQMHYQPLGRREVRTGILPEFAAARSNLYGSGQHQGYPDMQRTPMPQA